jgi:hypothetical protein
MKFKITLSQELLSDQTINGRVNIPRSRSSNFFELTYNLTKNCTTTDKFIDLTKQTVQSDGFRCDYNFYKNKTSETYFSMKKRMNSVIEEVSTMDELPDIDSSLMLNVSSGETESIKTNALHLYFELTSKDILHPSNKARDLLEEINQLVHSIEGGLDIYMKNIQPFYGTLRLIPKEGDVNKLPLTNEDYENFTVYHDWGDLILDYFTVGKDLYEAAGTNDVVLCKTNALSQQSTVHPCVGLSFSSPRIKGPEQEEITESVKQLSKTIQAGEFKSCNKIVWNEEDCLEYCFRSSSSIEDIKNQMIKKYNYMKVVIDGNTMRIPIDDNFKKHIRNNEIEKVNKWCDENDVRDYYDIDLPMYNFGRVVLGKIDMSDITKNEISTELSKCTGITNVELIDE